MDEQLPRSLRPHWFVFWGDLENSLGVIKIILLPLHDPVTAFITRCQVKDCITRCQVIASSAFLHLFSSFPCSWLSFCYFFCSSGVFPHCKMICSPPFGFINLYYNIMIYVCLFPYICVLFSIL